MAKFRKYALIALAIVAFLTLMFLLYKGTQRNEATPNRTATPSVSTSSAPVSSAPVQTPQVSEQSAQAAPAPEQPQQSQGAQDSPSESASPSAANTTKPSPSTSSDAGQEQHKADATSAAPSASGSSSGKEPTCPEDVSYQQVADGEADCTFDYSKVRLKTMQEAEQYARKWLYPEPGTYIQVRDYREAKVKIPGMDKPQSVFVVRAVARSSGDQGGSGAVTWSVIWPNGYYLTSDDLPDGIEAR